VGLRTLEASRSARGAEGANAALRESVHQAQRQWQLGADDDEVGADVHRELYEAADIVGAHRRVAS
jgi:hypothetical protein